MLLEKILEERKMSKYRLAKLSGVPQSTIADMCRPEGRLAKCAAGTLWKVAQALNLSVEELLLEEAAFEKYLGMPITVEHLTSKESLFLDDTMPSLQNFRSYACHLLKEYGDVGFIKKVLLEDMVFELFTKGWEAQALYLLALVDYVSRLHEVHFFSRYEPLRQLRLEQTAYPTGLILDAKQYGEQVLEEAKARAIPEFLRHNIVECEVRDVA